MAKPKKAAYSSGPTGPTIQDPQNPQAVSAEQGNKLGEAKAHVSDFATFR